MNIISKFLYRFTKEYKTKKQEDWERIWKYIQEKKSEENSEDYNSEKRHNNTCPKCYSNKNIVDKIQRTNGNINGSFSSFGGGYIGGSIDTDSVNHCNSCGHQWKKYKSKYYSDEDIVWKINYQLKDFMSDKREYYKSTYDDLQQFYAETIYRLLYNWTSEYSTIPTKKWLLKNFKSIYG